MNKSNLKGIGMLVGMIFGAGVFVLPFAVVKAGIFWGILHFFLALILVIFLHLWYGEVAYFTEGKHCFTGYAKILIGERAKWPAFLITIFTDYGALLVYGLLGGIFLANFFHLPPIILSIFVFAGGSILVLFHFEKVASINFYLTVALSGMVAVLFVIALPYIKIANFPVGNLKFSFSSDWFLPYGIWLFSLAGFSVLPEVRDIFSKYPIKNLKRVILISLSLCALLYLIFIFTIVGVSGRLTTKDALTGMTKILGSPALIIGSLFGFLAIFTSFIALGADLKNIFRYDFHFPKWLAWLSVVVPPIALFLSGAKNFVGILGVIGSVGLGLIGIFIILMVRKIRQKRGENGRFLILSSVVGILIMAGVIAAVISEVQSLF